MWLVRSRSWIWGLDRFKFKQARLVSLCGIGSRRTEVVWHFFCVSVTQSSEWAAVGSSHCALHQGLNLGPGQDCLLMVSVALFSYMAQAEWMHMCFFSDGRGHVAENSSLRGLASEMDAAADLVLRSWKLYHSCCRNSLSERAPQNSLSWSPSCCSFLFWLSREKAETCDMPASVRIWIWEDRENLLSQIWNH